MDTKSIEAAIHLLARAVYMTTVSLQEVAFELNRRLPDETNNRVILQNAVQNLQDVQARVDHLIIEDDQ